MELIESGTVWRHFQVMSNELNTPKILFCPMDADREKGEASVWGGTPTMPASVVVFTGDTNTSYFIGVDAADTKATMFLAGDRNVTVKNITLSPGLHSLGTNDPVGWSKALHVDQGNILKADASVEQFNTAGLKKAFENTGVTTNRLAVP